MAELKTRIGKLRAALIAIEQVNGSQLANEVLEADDADNEPMPVDLTDKQISAGLAAARASVLSFEFGDGSTAAQREAAYVAAFRAATSGVPVDRALHPRRLRDLLGHAVDMEAHGWKDAAETLRALVAAHGVNASAEPSNKPVTGD